MVGGEGWGNKTRETLNQEKRQEYTPNRTLHKSSKEIQWKKINLWSKVAGKVGYPHAKNK